MAFAQRQTGLLRQCLQAATHRSAAATSPSSSSTSSLSLPSSTAAAFSTYTALRAEDGTRISSTPSAARRPHRESRKVTQPDVFAAEGSEAPEDSTPSRTKGGSSSSLKNVDPDVGAAPMSFLSLDDFPRFLNKPHPVLDRGNVFTNPNSKFGSQAYLYGDPVEAKRAMDPAALTSAVSGRGGAQAGGMGATDADIVQDLTPLTYREIQKLHRHTLAVRRVVRMTGKGKIPSFAVLVVAGNGEGLVGFGQGKSDDVAVAAGKAFQEAVQSMDLVTRFESRTVQKSLTGVFSASTVHIRPRPPGFGLRCPPVVHAIARSCGIRDLSASITGSTNPINVCRATLSALYGGAKPLTMGDGFGRRGRREDKGEGQKTLEDLEVERGRRFRPVRAPGAA